MTGNKVNDDNSAFGRFFMQNHVSYLTASELYIMWWHINVKAG